MIRRSRRRPYSSASSGGRPARRAATIGRYSTKPEIKKKIETPTSRWAAYGVSGLSGRWLRYALNRAW